jgi:hypothetical protein
VVLLCYLDVDGVLGDGLPDNDALLTQFLGGLVKIFGVIIGADKDLPSCEGDCIVSKFPAQFPVADGGILREVELLIMDVGPYAS